jgi:hypothetical protein
VLLGVVNRTQALNKLRDLGARDWERCLLERASSVPPRVGESRILVSEK